MKTRRIDGCYDGYLMTKLHAIGTRSEGPQYFLQRWDYREERIVKKSAKDEEDPELHCLVGCKVRLRGRRFIDGIHYYEVEALSNLDDDELLGENELSLSLDFDSEILYVNANIIENPESRIIQFFDMTLTVEWFGESVWRRTCPTAQIYDFSIWHDDYEIWRWSEGRYIPDSPTTITIPRDEPACYRETWYFLPSHVVEEGSYRARATFLPSGESCEGDFEIRFL